MKTQINETFVFALGGLGEVGKNMYALMHDNEIIIIDCGVMFPEGNLPGIDYILADYTFLQANQDKIKGLFITHGHEDHIGGIPYLVSNVNIPMIYAPKVAAELIKKKLEDRGIAYSNIVIFDENTKVDFKHFSVEFFRTTHSIPDSYGISIMTPNGRVVETGDFKFDLTPIGPMANLAKMAKLGEDGVKLLMTESTNALIPGFSQSENAVDEALGDIIRSCKGRIILATFASNIYRLVHIIETCKKNNRKVAAFGRSMVNNIEIAKSCNLITDKSVLITSDEAKKAKPENLCLLVTGSQGEPLAALSRIANGIDSNITLMPEDTVIFSSSAIPGNALSINRVVNKLYLKGATVYTTSDDVNIHTSGHGRQDELKLLLRLMKPQYVMPIHGEYRMLKAHVKLAEECGVPKENAFILKNGDMLALSKDGVRVAKSIPINDIYVDGKRIGDIGTSVIRDRKIMSNDGVLVVILNINKEKKELTIDPNVTTRGFVVVNDNQELINSIQTKVKSIVVSELNKSNYNLTDLKNRIILELNTYIIESTGRRPMIMPMIFENKIK